MVDYQLKLKLSLATINRVRACQAKSVFLKKVEKLQARLVFLFKNLRMSVQMLKKKFDIKNLRIFKDKIKMWVYYF